MGIKTAIPVQRRRRCRFLVYMSVWKKTLPAGAGGKPNKQEQTYTGSDAPRRTGGIELFTRLRSDVYRRPFWGKPAYETFGLTAANQYHEYQRFGITQAVKGLYLQSKVTRL